MEAIKFIRNAAIVSLSLATTFGLGFLTGVVAETKVLIDVFRDRKSRTNSQSGEEEA